MTLRRSSRTVSVWVLTTMPSVQGVVHDAGTPLVPSTSTRHIRQEPNAARESVAHSLGIGTPASVAARSTDVPSGTCTSRPSIVTDARPTVSASRTAGVPRSTSGAQELRCSMRVMRVPLVVGSKSSGKCLIALCTGIGVSPPIAHSEPLVMVSQRSSSSTRLAATSLPGDDPVDRLHTAGRPDPARRALAARLDRAELHREPRHPGHVDGVVEDHDAAVPEHRAGLGESLVVHRDVEAGRRHVGAERAADLRGAHRAAGQRAAAVALDQLAQAHAERQLDDAALLTLPASWKTWVPRERPVPSSAYAAPPSARIIGTAQSVSTLLTAVGRPHRPLMRGDRRLGAHLAAAALEALEHRGLLAADVGAGADADVQVEGEAGAEDVLAEVAVGVRRLDRAPQGGDGVGVLGADVDVALARADGVGRDGHALDERERVALDEHPVGEGAGVALVEVAGDELQVGRRSRGRSAT